MAMGIGRAETINKEVYRRCYRGSACTFQRVPKGDISETMKTRFFYSACTLYITLKRQRKPVLFDKSCNIFCRLAW